MFAEFRKFITRGNVMDLAVGIIIGAAFTSIVNSLVKDIIMPPVGYITGGVDFTDLFITLDGGEYASLVEAQEAGGATINYGVFINQVITFLIVALAVFFIVRAVNRLNDSVQRAKEEKPPDPTEKDCPYCFSRISIQATRCPHCTSELTGGAAAD